MSLVKFTVNRDSPKWVLNSSGYLSTGSSESNYPSFEFNPDGTYKGLLIETETKNQFLGKDFWEASDVTTITYDSIVSPSGNQDGYYIGDNGRLGTGNVFVSQSISSIVDESDYVVSAFFKKPYSLSNPLNIDWVKILVRETTDRSAFFDVNNGQTGSNDRFDYIGIDDYGNGWYRCWVKWKQTFNNNNIDLYFELATEDGKTSVELDGSSYLGVWGVQVEEKSYPSSYTLPLETVIRESDDIFLENAFKYIGQNKGTIIVEFYINKLTPNIQYILYITDTESDFSDSISFRISQSNNFQINIDANDGGTDIDFTTPATIGRHKLALVYDGTGDNRVYLDGTLIEKSVDLFEFSNTLSTIFLGSFGEYSFGSISNIVQQFDNYILSYAFSKEPLSDEKVERLTSI